MSDPRVGPRVCAYLAARCAGKSYGQIALRYGVSKSTVRAAITYALDPKRREAVLASKRRVTLRKETPNDPHPQS